MGKPSARTDQDWMRQRNHTRLLESRPASPSWHHPKLLWEVLPAERSTWQKPATQAAPMVARTRFLRTAPQPCPIRGEPCYPVPTHTPRRLDGASPQSPTAMHCSARLLPPSAARGKYRRL